MTRKHITADIRQVERLGRDYARAAEVGMHRLVERGEQIVRDEVPKVTRNLAQGISSDVKVLGGGASLRGEIIATARSGRLGSRQGILHRASGKTKKVRLRAVPAFNYAEAVAKGTGEFGPQRAAIRPKKAKALLVPVDAVPSLNGKPASYIEADGRIFVLRRSMKGMRPNPYDERAARRLDGEAQPIFDRALKDFVGGKS